MARTTLNKKMKSAGDAWKERPIPLDAYTTAAEAVKAGHFASEAALVAAAYRDRAVRVDRVFRPAIQENPRITVQELAKIGNAFMYPEPGTRAHGERKPKLKKEARDKARKTVSAIPIEKIRGLGEDVARSFVALGSITPSQFEEAFPGRTAISKDDIAEQQPKAKKAAAAAK